MNLFLCRKDRASFLFIKKINKLKLFFVKKNESMYVEKYRMSKNRNSMTQWQQLIPLAPMVANWRFWIEFWLFSQHCIFGNTLERERRLPKQQKQFSPRPSQKSAKFYRQIWTNFDVDSAKMIDEDEGR